MAWTLDNYLWREKISVAAAKVSGGPHANFPLLVSDTSANLSSYALANGNDIVYTDTSGSLLSWEIESFTKGTGVVVSRVLVSSLATTTEIYRYFGYASATNQENASAVFPNHAHRWTINETGTNDRLDTKGVYDATTVNYEGDEDVAGQIDRADNFDGAVPYEYLNINGAAIAAASNTYTIKLWFNTTSTSVNNFIYGEANTGNAAPAITVGLSGGDLYFIHQDDAFNAAILFKAGTGAGGYADGTWHELVGVRKAVNDWEMFVDGVSEDTDNTNVGATTINNARIGAINVGGTTYPYTGMADEARISLTDRSDSGLRTTMFNNEDDPGSFYTVGTVEKRPARRSWIMG